MDEKTTEAAGGQKVARTILLSREVLEDLRRTYGMHEPLHPGRTFDQQTLPPQELFSEGLGGFSILLRSSWKIIRAARLAIEAFACG